MYRKLVSDQIITINPIYCNTTVILSFFFWGVMILTILFPCDVETLLGEKGDGYNLLTSKNPCKTSYKSKWKVLKEYKSLNSAMGTLVI